jgi:hypothetical protein
MSDQNRVVVNIVEKGQIDHLLKGCGCDWPPRTFECQCLLVTEGVNLLNMKFFDAVARLEAGLAQFSNALDQRG